MNNDQLLNDIIALRAAVRHAAAFSTDDRTQNGAILMDRYSSFAYGANHLPAGVKNTTERWNWPAKGLYVEHAERNAIYDAARRGEKTAGSTMYCPWFACADCARAIIQCGIVRVVGCTNGNICDGRWKESVEAGIEMLQEAGVECVWIEQRLFPDDSVALRRHGQLIYL